MIERWARASLEVWLSRFPAVLLRGARQVGKSTLAQQMVSKRWPAAYRTLDDRTFLDAALNDPQGVVEGLSTPVVLDEVQRAPEVLLGIKREIDRDRASGRYLLTGSANLLTMQSVRETLAGRIAVHDLHPFALAEKLGLPLAPHWQALWKSRDAKSVAARLPSMGRIDRRAIGEFILSGGYPSPALEPNPSVRRQWFDSYRQTYLERDVREITHVAHLPEFNRLLTAIALRTGQILNIADVARDLGIPLTTVRRYLYWLETTFQIFLLQPYFSNRGKRLVKTPKVYMEDTGLACYLSAATEWSDLEAQGRAGALVESWVAGELRKRIALSTEPLQLFYWRTHGGQEVDFLIERGPEVIAIEVKWGQRIDGRARAGLNALSELLKDKLKLSLILYGGSETIVLDAKTLLVPLRRFFC